MQYHITVYQELQNGVENEHCVTGWVFWMFHFDPETKQQSSQWKSPTYTPQKAEFLKSAGKIVIIFFDQDGFIY